MWLSFYVDVIPLTVVKQNMVKTVYIAHVSFTSNIKCSSFYEFEMDSTSEGYLLCILLQIYFWQICCFKLETRLTFYTVTI